ncbi:hypothetical protein KQX54_011697 [Cotesia glomerata]|uniref:Uncharacterized protein n=1 Tax=Cotesia glomerata TaxID=32391 RepID=A0AAV7IK74_COTGL|nr:hypothetical protein KQX54_011697 [Cotesia glomerata]
MVNTEPLLVTHHENLGEISRKSTIDIRRTMTRKVWDVYITRQVSHYLQQNSLRTRDVETQTVETRNFPIMHLAKNIAPIAGKSGIAMEIALSETARQLNGCETTASLARPHIQCLIHDVDAA